MKSAIHFLFFLAPLFFSSKILAQLLSPQIDSIPMSDGKKLAADIYIPSGMSNGPVVLVQTPYNRILYRFAGLPLQIKYNLNSSNYIFVIVDWRGFYGSKNAAYAGAPKNGEDGYDVVEWIAQQSWSNEKIGTWGPSALGRVQFSTAKTNPPHLICICPLVAGPQYEFPEYFPGGCVRTEYVEQLDGLGFGMSPLLMNHTVHDIYWTAVGILNSYPDSIQVPCFMIGGWYDHTIEQMLPFFTALQKSSRLNVRDKHRLLMGPWVHGGHGTSQVGTSMQGQLSYPNADRWNDSLSLLFFDYYLRNISNGWDQTPAVQYYQMGENIWQSSSAFPPGGTVNTNFYLHGDNSMDNDVWVNVKPDTLTLHYNPNNPSPTIGGPTLRADLEQGPYDQSPLVESRNDILVFTTKVLTENVVMKGSATVHLKISSNRKDTDFNIRLTDVYPDGRSMLVNDGVLRMRFRSGFNAADTAAMIPGQLYDCVIKLPNTCITFLIGHKIRVDVTSSNYPRFNRNANTNGNMYPGKSLDSLVNPLAASNTIYMSDGLSYITMPLVGYDDVKNVNKETNELIVYPNPTDNILNISSFANQANGILQLCDLQGRIILEKNISNQSETLSLENFSKGIYFLKVKTAKQMLAKKIIVN